MARSAHSPIQQKAIDSFYEQVLGKSDPIAIDILHFDEIVQNLQEIENKITLESIY